MAESHEGVACHRKSQKDKNGQQIVLYPNPRSFRLASPPHQTYTPNNEHLVPEMDRLPTTNFSVALLLGTWISNICRLQILSTWIHMYIMYIMYMSCVCFQGSLSLETLRLQLQGHQTWSAPSNQVTNTTTDWHPPRISGWCPRRTLAFKENFRAESLNELGPAGNFPTNLPGPSWSFQSAGRDLPPGVPTKNPFQGQRTSQPLYHVPTSVENSKTQEWHKMIQPERGRKKSGLYCVHIYIYCLYMYIFFRIQVHIHINSIQSTI